MSIKRLFLSSLVFLFLLFTTSFSFAEMEKTATSGAKVKIEYTLPYPGILPGHPLYPLKMLRDRILSSFITDPLKKAEFSLLQADKRLNSGLFLLEQGKVELAEQTFSKGEVYLEQSLTEAEQAKKLGKETGALVSKLSLAVLKHQEVLTEVLGKVPDSAKPGIQNSLEKAQRGIERIREIQTQKLEQRVQERRLGIKRGISSAEAQVKPNGK